MAGKFWQPSYEPPCRKRRQAPVTMKDNGKREGRVEGRELSGRSIWNFDECTCVETADHKGTQTRFVVNSDKLHLTA